MFIDAVPCLPEPFCSTSTGQSSISRRLRSKSWFPPDLTVALERLSKRAGGALAFVSGRPLAELDLFFQPLKLPAIAGHGAELRLADGTVTRAKTFLDPQLKAEIASIADDKPGVVVEDKGYSFAMHYRQAPHLGHAVRDEVSAVCARFPSARSKSCPASPWWK